MNTAAWPSPVMTEVRSVPHMTSTRSVVIVPSWALEPCGRPARWCANRRFSRISRTASAGADAGKAQPGPQLAVALAMKGAVSEQLLDRRYQAFVRHRALRPGSPADGLLRAMTVSVNGRP